MKFQYIYILSIRLNLTRNSLAFHKLFVCECTKDDDREVAALMSTRLWNFHIYVIICLFVQGLDCSIASQIKSVFAEFPWHRHLVTRKMAEASTVDDALCSGLNLKNLFKNSQNHIFLDIVNLLVINDIAFLLKFGYFLNFNNFQF